MISEVALIAIDALDQLGRQRALTDRESLTLQRLIANQEDSPSGFHRIAVWRTQGLTAALAAPKQRPLATAKFQRVEL